MTAEDLFQAVKQGDLAAVNSVLDRDPDLLQARDPGGLSAVLLAAYYGRKEVLNDLLGRGPRLTVFEAAAAQHLAVAEVLTENGADVNVPSAGGSTALHRAAQNGQLSLVRLLLEHGARPDVADDEGVTPRQLARKENHTEVADLLQRRGG